MSVPLTGARGRFHGDRALGIRASGTRRGKGHCCPWGHQGAPSDAQAAAGAGGKSRRESRTAKPPGNGGSRGLGSSSEVVRLEISFRGFLTFTSTVNGISFLPKNLEFRIFVSYLTILLNS